MANSSASSTHSTASSDRIIQGTEERQTTYKFNPLRGFFTKNKPKSSAPSRHQGHILSDENIPSIEWLFEHLSDQEQGQNSDRKWTSPLSPNLAFFVSEKSLHEYLINDIARTNTQIAQEEISRRLTLAKYIVDAERDGSLHVPFVILHGELLDAFAHAKALECNRSQRRKTRSFAAQNENDVCIVIGVVDIEKLPKKPSVSAPYLKRYLECKENTFVIPDSRLFRLGPIPENVIKGIMPWSVIEHSPIAKDWFRKILVDHRPVVSDLEPKLLFRAEEARKFWLEEFQPLELSPRQIFLAFWKLFEFNSNEEWVKQLVAVFFGWAKGHLRIRLEEQQPKLLRDYVDMEFTRMLQWQKSQTKEHADILDMSQVEQLEQAWNDARPRWLRV